MWVRAKPTTVVFMSTSAPASEPAQHTQRIISSGWAQVTVIIAVLGVVGACLTFLTGGVHPQWQSDIADLRASIAQMKTDTDKALVELRSAQAAASVAAASDRAQLNQRIDTAVELFNTRLNGMWRQSDYVDRDAHLSRLDTVYDALRDRLRDQEYLTRGLSTQPVRNPR